MFIIKYLLVKQKKKRKKKELLLGETEGGGTPGILGPVGWGVGVDWGVGVGWGAFWVCGWISCLGASCLGACLGVLAAWAS